MNKRNWKILYSNYSGPEKRAVDFICREMGSYLLRDKDIYSFHILACEKAQGEITTNAVIVGTYDENLLIRKYIKKEEVPQKGYIVKIIDNPENTKLKLALICGDTCTEVFYGAADFIDDYFVKAIPIFDYIRLERELFMHPLPDYCNASSPNFKTRSVFTWGHPLAQYQNYLHDLARMKLNQVIIWNDFLPINSAEIVEYAHSLGIEVIWGFAWGWSQKCDKADITDLESLKNYIISKYNKNYKIACGDGIYFQSFTELPVDKINGVTISQAVTELVNMTAEELFNDNPGLRIQFGLHATSVKEHLADIAKVDPRIEILWEDCGAFPYKQFNHMARELEYDNGMNAERQTANIDFTDKMLSLRKNAGSGLVYKCQLTMDWSRERVEHQAGPYVLGAASDYTLDIDKDLTKTAWRFYNAEWLENGRYAHDLYKHVYEKTCGNVNMCMAGMFSGGINFATALSSEMLWNCQKPYEQIVNKVLLRKNVNF